MEKYENYIWDFDGTLFESYRRMSLAFWKAMQHYAAAQNTILPVTQGEVRQKMKRSVGYAWKWYQAKYGLPDTVIEEYTLLEKEMPEEPFAPYAETASVLRALKAEGARHFVYTHRGNETIEYLKRFGLLELFQRCITAADGFPPKPSPEALRYLIQTYHLTPAKSLMIGDRLIDMEAAVNAGIPGCLFDPENEISDVRDQHHIQNLNELIDRHV